MKARGRADTPQTPQKAILGQTRGQTVGEHQYLMSWGQGRLGPQESASCACGAV